MADIERDPKSQTGGMGHRHERWLLCGDLSLEDIERSIVGSRVVVMFPPWVKVSLLGPALDTPENLCWCGAPLEFTENNVSRYSVWDGGISFGSLTHEPVCKSCYNWFGGCGG